MYGLRALMSLALALPAPALAGARAEAPSGKPLPTVTLGPSPIAAASFSFSPAVLAPAPVAPDAARGPSASVSLAEVAHAAREPQASAAALDRAYTGAYSPAEPAAVLAGIVEAAEARGAAAPMSNRRFVREHGDLLRAIPGVGGVKARSGPYSEPLVEFLVSERSFEQAVRGVQAYGASVYPSGDFIVRGAGGSWKHFLHGEVAALASRLAKMSFEERVAFLRAELGIDPATRRAPTWREKLASRFRRKNAGADPRLSDPEFARAYADLERYLERR